MEAVDTASLRAAAPRWTLAGDRQLLDALQQLHEKITSKCKETNEKLEAMVTALDDAGVCLQNANNRFLALSSGQFVESRVYDEEVAAAAGAPPAEQSKTDPASAECELDQLRRSLRALAESHESVAILHASDSDTDSDTSDTARLVLRPRERYARRPLPHVIGSAAWKSKWHAGLVAEDSGSSASSGAPRGAALYSDSDSGAEAGAPGAARVAGRATQRTVSASSSEAASERHAAPEPAPARPSPSDVAAALARRLGGQPPERAAPAPARPAACSPARQLYSARRPTAGTVFPDEPPPMEPSDRSDDEYSRDDDIFAELHSDGQRGRAVDAPLGGRRDLRRHGDRDRVASDEDGDIFSDVAEVVDDEAQRRRAARTALFDDEPEPGLFAEPPSGAASAKKPVGGVSLFGTNTNSENIGAAILKRTRSKSSTSGDESNTDDSREPRDQTAKKNIIKKDKDLFDYLFAKSEKQENISIQKKIAKDIVVEKNNKVGKKIDFFDDHLFDDIDDIFNSNIVTKTPDKVVGNTKKSLFDDDDDLFADIAVTTKVCKTDTKITKDTNPGISTRSIFDSDDDLFTDKNVTADKYDPHNKKSIKKLIKVEINKVNEPSIVKEIAETKSLFDESLFKNCVKDSTSVLKTSQSDLEIKSSIDVQNTKIKTDIDNNKNDKTDDNDLFDNNNDLFNKRSSAKEIESKKTFKKGNQESTKTVIDDNFLKANEEKLKPVINSPSLFDDDDDDERIDDLFVKTTQSSKQSSEGIISDKLFKPAKDTDKENPDKIEIGSKIINTAGENKTSDPNTSSIFVMVNATSTDLSQNNSNSEKASLEIKHKEEMVNDDSIENGIFTIPKQKEIMNVVHEKTADLVTNSSLETADNIFKDNLEDKLLQNAKKPTTLMHKEIPSNEIKKASIEPLNIVQKPAIENKKKDKEYCEPKLPDLYRKQTEYSITESNVIEPNLDNISYKQSELDNMKDVDSNKNFNNKMETKDSKPDIFCDIFNDQPPDFEKPKEPKRSKNINALFDDDSDDEALFFKKNEVIVDDKPEDVGSMFNQDLFDIFHDEPPAIDVDFVKSIKTGVFDDLSDGPADDFFRKPSKIKIKNSDEVLFSPQIKQNIGIENESLPDLPRESKSQTIDNIDGTTVTHIQNVETKQVGKLKPMNLNINVKNLLPGASPKKTQKIQEQTDGQAVSTKSNEELHKNSGNDNKKEVESKLVKSVSFDGDTDSSVLDNKLSKERAKIQVKRRPSTRRARRDAIKKSGIDFGEDSTDNSSSIDDQPKSNEEKSESNTTKTKSGEDTSVQVDRTVQGNESISSYEFDENINEKILDKQKNQEKLNTNIAQVQKVLQNENVSPYISPSKDVKSKVVYILNDEDIFTNADPKSKDVKPKILNIVDDDDDDIFKTMTVATKTHVSRNHTYDTAGIKTLGKVYKESTKTNHNEDKTKSTNISSDDDIFKDFANFTTTSKNQSNTTAIQITDRNESTSNKGQEETHTKQKRTIFDDLSDEEDKLFNKKTSSVTKKSSVFISDSEEELFASKRETKNLEKEIKKLELKKTLFDDEDDGDLFGAKISVKQSTDGAAPPRAPPPAARESARPAFEDPLSLLGDE